MNKVLFWQRGDDPPKAAREGAEAIPMAAGCRQQSQHSTSVAGKEAGDTGVSL